jgi:hypothetical protein
MAPLLNFRAAISIAALAALLPCVAVARTHPGPAPADEYFGPFKQSILGIRNHITDFEAKADAEFVPEKVLKGIDNLEVAIEDWHSQYPKDSWVPKFLDRIVHLYARAHSTAHAQCTRALALLKRDYKNTAFARDAQAVVADEQTMPVPATTSMP